MYCEDLLDRRRPAQPLEGREVAALWGQATPESVSRSGKPHIKEQDCEAAVYREKSILYLRHRLQKYFLSLTGPGPRIDETADADTILQSLEDFEGPIETWILRKTKVHKVVEAIGTMSDFPTDLQWDYRRRCAMLWAGYKKLLDAEDQILLDMGIERRLLAALHGEWASPDSEDAHKPQAEGGVGDSTG